MHEIQNYEVYTTGMKKSIYDKMFFVDKIFDDNINTLIDFGCADGELIRHLHAFMPNVRLIGYDVEEKFLVKARQNAPFAEFYSNWDDIHVDPKKTIVNLSSVLHEIYDYLPHKELELFWKRLRTPGFAYITIRDMFFPSCEKPVDPRWKTRVRKTKYGDTLNQYEKFWGACFSEEDMLQFLMKYRYSENWEREMHEDYFPVSADSIRLRLSDYQEVYCQHTPLPYLVHQVQRDFGIDISGFKTHMHWIFKLDTTQR